MFITIITLGIIALFTYNLNVEKPDVRYTLSENIPMSISGTTETIQQLEVRNLGNGEAKQISVNIKGLITSYEVINYSQSDKVESFKKDNFIEVVYPLLPPEGSFKIVIKSKDQGISKNDVNINHSKGKATEVFSDKKTSQFSLNYILIGFLVLMFFVEGRSIAINSLEDSVTHKYESILRRKIPFYLWKKEKWHKIRKMALHAQVTAPYFHTFGDIEKHPAFKALSYEKPEYLDDKEWDYLCELAKEILGKNIITRIAESHHIDFLKAVFSLKKPLYYDILKWNEAQKMGWKKYIALKKEEVQNALGHIPSKLKVEIESQKPDFIPAEIWIDYIRFLNAQCYQYLATELQIVDIASIFLSSNQQFMEVIDEYQRDSLKSRAYRKDLLSLPTVVNTYGAKKFLEMSKPDWIANKDYEELLKNANDLLELEELTKTYRTKLDLLNKIVLTKSIPSDKPENLDQDEWKDLLLLEEQIKQILQKASDQEDKERNLVKLESQAIELRDILRYKLTIIDNFLVDPTILDKIEKEDLFALGNLNNLKTLAKLIDKSRTA